MEVCMDCPCGGRVRDEADFTDGDADLRLECGRCGSGYIATITRYSGPA